MVTLETGLSRRSANKDRKSTRLNSSHGYISYAVFCLKKTTDDTLVHRQVRHLESLCFYDSRHNRIARDPVSTSLPRAGFREPKRSPLRREVPTYSGAT